MTHMFGLLLYAFIYLVYILALLVVLPSYSVKVFPSSFPRLGFWDTVPACQTCSLALV